MVNAAPPPPSLKKRAHLRVLSFCAAALLSAFSPPAAADKIDDDAKKAEELFKEGRAALDRKDYATGCPKFQASLELVRRAGTLFNVAQCEEHDGRLVAAMRYYKEGIVILEPGDPRLGPSKKRLAAIEPLIPHITVHPADDFPKDARVTVDGKEIEALGKEVPIDPGEHTIAVLAPKRTEEKLVVTLAEKERKEVTVRAGKPVLEPPRATVRVVEPLGPRRIAGIAALGVGALGFIGAAITGGVVVSRNAIVEDPEKGCPDAQCKTFEAYEAAQTGKTLLAVNTAAWVIGFVGAGAGAFLLFYPLKKKGDDKPKAAAHELVIGPGFLGARGSF